MQSPNTLPKVADELAARASQVSHSSMQSFCSGLDGWPLSPPQTGSFPSAFRFQCLAKIFLYIFIFIFI